MKCMTKDCLSCTVIYKIVQQKSFIILILISQIDISMNIRCILCNINFRYYCIA